MRLCAFTCLFVLAPFVAAEKPAEPKTAEKILGKWEATESEIKGAVFDFAKDGVVKLALTFGEQKINLEGKYKFATEDTLEFTFKGPDGKEKTDKAKFKFDKENLVITDPDGKPVKFARVK